MSAVTDAVDEMARRTGFSGVVRVERDGDPEWTQAYSLADRAHGVPMTVDTQLAIASGTKGLTALTALSLVEEGAWSLETSARSLLGDDLPQISDGVTVRLLLEHRSGIAESYDDEDEADAQSYARSIHELDTSEAYLRLAEGRPRLFAPGERFEYCNAGFQLVAVMVERLTGRPFSEVLAERVTGPAGMTDTMFLRTDELPGTAAVGYPDPEGLRTNVFQIAVRGTGDGGIYTTAADVSRLWTALFAGSIVSPDLVELAHRPHSDVPWMSAPTRCGLGFFRRVRSDAVFLGGADAGVSFPSQVDATTRRRFTVMSNTSDAVLPIVAVLEADQPSGSGAGLRTP